MNQSILIIDDDPELQTLLGSRMEDDGYSVDYAQDGESGLNKALTNKYSLVIIDVQMPKMSGFEVCKRLRLERKQLPIMMLTAKSEEIDKVLGLEFGADDYLTKPFSFRELSARVNAIFRRVNRSGDQGGEAKTNLVFGDLTIDVAKREVLIRGEVIHLPPSEYNLLYYLARHPGQAFARDELTEKVWGYSASGYEQVVTTALSRLRNKIEPDPDKPIYIITVRSFGYRFARHEDFEK